MDISRDLRRKMIIKLIEALKDSPSFCNISDSQLNEAVLNSEHQTFQLCKSKEEYMAHINEKLRKIKQSSIIKGEDKGGEERMNYNKNKYEEERNGKIINGNIPPYVKISQIYTQETPNYSGLNTRKVDMFSGRMYGSNANLSNVGNGNLSNVNLNNLSSNNINLNNISSNMNLNSNLSSNINNNNLNINNINSNNIDQNNIYGQNREYNNYFNIESSTEQINKQYNNEYFNRNSYGYSSTPKNEYNQFNGATLYARPNNFEQPNFKNNNSIYFQNSAETPQFSERGTFYEKEQKPFQNKQKRVFQLDSISEKTIKPENYSERYLSERYSSEIENDLRLVRNPSFISPSKSINSSSSSSSSSINSNITAVNNLSSNININSNNINLSNSNNINPNINSNSLKRKDFEYSYGNTISNKSYVGNINPSLLNNKKKDDLFSFKNKLFDDKKSEELFKSFSDEFMKSNKNSPINSNLEESDSSYDDQIPEKLQSFLDSNNLGLKEIKNGEEWIELVKRVLENNENSYFKKMIEIQSEFIDFPFLDESDLKGFLKEIEKDKKEELKSINKEDYLEFIDKAIEAFSEKQKQNSGFY